MAWMTRGVGLGAAAVLMALAGSAVAQNALDKNLEVGSGGVNPRKPTMQEELRLRNAVVTGNAPGGQSFRGNVGYRASGDFSGRLGSNDTFTFRRDAAFSGLGGQGLRATDALQYQFAYTTGRAAPSGVGSPMFINRSGASTPASQLRAGAAAVPTAIVPSRGPGQALDNSLELDDRGLSLLMLRSPSAFVANRQNAPSVLGTFSGQGGMPLNMTASSLRGVVYEPALRGTWRDLERRERGDDEKPEGSLNQGPIDSALPSATPSGEGEPARRPVVVLRNRDGSLVAEQDSTPEAANWRTRLEALRQELSSEPMRPVARATPSAATEPGAQNEPAPTEGAPAESAASGEASRDPAVVEVLRQAGGDRVVKLSAEGQDAYSEHMQQAQRHLAGRRYFDAEQRFVAAQSSRPGDAMAAVGRVHSQIGAGMFVSASISVRQLLTDHPELIATRYGEQLLPTNERMVGAIVRLREIIAGNRARAKDPALLLAYIGHQTGDRAIIVEGLDALDASLAAGQIGGEAPDTPETRLARLVRELWLNPLIRPRPGLGGETPAPQDRP